MKLNSVCSSDSPKDILVRRKIQANAMTQQALKEKEEMLVLRIKQILKENQISDVIIREYFIAGWLVVCNFLEGCIQYGLN